jgi:hypothetical protein
VGQARAADPPAERVQLIYSAGAGCVDAAAFSGEVSARIHRPIDWVVSPAERVIAVDMSPGDGETRGSVEMRSPPPVTRREFVAATCAEVSAALSLVVALALDPNARVELSPSTGAAAPPANGSFPEERAPAPAAAVVEPPPEPQPLVDAPPPPSKPRRKVLFSAGPLAGVAAGYTPVALVTVGGVLGLRSAAQSWLAPAFQLSLSWGKTGSTGPSAEGATFGYTLGRLEGCPVHWVLTPLLAISPCALLELGSVSAEGASAGVDVPEDAQRFWSSVGASLTLAGHAGAFFTRLDLYGAVPLTRYEFAYLEPFHSVFQPSVVVAGGVVAVGIEL